MFWIALCPSREAERTAWGWWALRFTPRVAWLQDALLLEASASLRLFGGRRELLRLLLQTHPGLGEVAWATGPTARVALALLRLKQAGQGKPARLPDDLPLPLLDAARPHAPLLERTGIRTWGQLRALPRAGVARRFGAPLLAALDQAWGTVPETLAWITAPEDFDLGAELASLATGAPDLLLPATQLLERLQLWLQARNRGVLALELEWTLDLKRLDGVELPPRQQLVLRTAEPTQDMVHLRRLAHEQLERARLLAPANHLRLRSLETVPWGGATTSLLPGEQRQGERLHQLVERLSARLGDDAVVVPVACADHRPEVRQSWAPARSAKAAPPPLADALLPTWVLPQPLRLRLQGDRPCYGGPLHRLARLYRIETAWWEPGGAALRDYFIARSPRCGLVWIYRERPLQLAPPAEADESSSPSSQPAPASSQRTLASSQRRLGPIWPQPHLAHAEWAPACAGATASGFQLPLASSQSSSASSQRRLGSMRPDLSTDVPPATDLHFRWYLQGLYA